MRKIFCRICGARQLDYKPLISLKNGNIPAQGFFKTKIPKKLTNLEIFQCNYCDVIQHPHEPVSYFKDVIRATSFSDEMKKFRSQQLALWVKKYNLNSKKILEIGSGKGEFLSIINSIGNFQIFGIENSKKSRISNFDDGFVCFNGYLGNLNSNFLSKYKRNFDAFMCFSFMEHWPNPKKSFQQLNYILNDESVGLIEVPNFDLIYKKSIYTEFSIDHIFYFTKKTLKKTLELFGFEVLKINTIWHNYILSAEVKKRKPLSFKSFNENFYSINNELNKVLKKYSIDDTVVWGAGHQSLSVISQSRAFKFINCIVDSAIFKQNLYVFGINIMVKAPSFIKENNISTVVIIAAGYSDEIAKILIQDYKSVKNIYILRENFIEKIK